MTFSIDAASKPKRQVRAAARERLDLAINALTALEVDAGTDVESTIHEVRKRCKEVRALARLVRPAIGAEFDRFNRRVRDAAMELSSVRDAHAVLATLDDLRTHPERGGDPTLAAVRDRQAQRAADATSSMQPGDPRIRRAAERLVAARKGVRRWEIDDPNWLEQGLRATYRRGRRSLARAQGEPTDEHVHEWRKSVKTLWYQIRLIESAAPSVLAPLVARLDDLSDALGDDHDLAVLISLLDADSEAGSDLIRSAVEHARAQQHELRQRAFRLGATLFAEPTGAFVRRVVTYWSAAAEFGPELATGGIAELVADEQRVSGASGDVPAEAHVEIERKFLVAEPPELPAAGRELRQGYLAIDGTVSLRVRDAGSKGCTMTVKGGRGAVRTELEWPISIAQFEAAWEHTGGRRVDKTRYLILLDGSELDRAPGTAVVDVFHGELDGLVLVEVEFESDEEMAAFVAPEWFGREVTDDARYTNASLAVNGRPPT